MRPYFKACSGIHVHIGRLTNPAGISRTRVRYRAFTNVVRQILTNKEVIRVANDLIRAPISKRTGIKHIQGTEPALYRPINVIKLVFNIVV